MIVRDIMEEFLRIESTSQQESQIPIIGFDDICYQIDCFGARKCVLICQAVFLSLTKRYSLAEYICNAREQGGIHKRPPAMRGMLNGSGLAARFLRRLVLHAHAHGAISHHSRRHGHGPRSYRCFTRASCPCSLVMTIEGFRSWLFSTRRRPSVRDHSSSGADGLGMVTVSGVRAQRHGTLVTVSLWDWTPLGSPWYRRMVRLLPECVCRTGWRLVRRRPTHSCHGP